LFDDINNNNDKNKFMQKSYNVFY